MENNNDRSDKYLGFLSENLQRLELMQQDLKSLGLNIMNADKGAVWSADLFFLGAIKKSLSITRGFINEMCNDNYVCAAALLRVHLDSALRAFAITLVDDRNAFIDTVMDGGEINHIKDRNGKPLTDSYLHHQLNKIHGWVSEVYTQASGFVHLSDKHIFSIIKEKSDQDRTYSIILSEKDELIPEKVKNEATLAMIAVNQLMLAVCDPWIDHKKSKKNDQGSSDSSQP